MARDEIKTSARAQDVMNDSKHRANQFDLWRGMSVRETLGYAKSGTKVAVVGLGWYNGIAAVETPGWQSIFGACPLHFGGGEALNRGSCVLRPAVCGNQPYQRRPRRADLGSQACSLAQCRALSANRFGLAPTPFNAAVSPAVCKLPGAVERPGPNYCSMSNAKSAPICCDFSSARGSGVRSDTRLRITT